MTWTAVERGWLRRLPKDAAVNLAVFRIVVCILFLTTSEIRTAEGWAVLPTTLAVAPRGWGWALALFPPNAAVARVADIVTLVGAAFGLVGCYARAACACLTIAALYLLALPLRSGLPYHYQHLVWFAALCAVSPCADALAIDGWRRRLHGGPTPARSAAYGVPLRMAWLLVGAIFFFPGLWKLRASGLGWITSDNLRNQLYWKWAVVPALVPPFRIDRFPWLLHAGAAAVVALELSFAFAVWHRSWRGAAVAAALAFHACAYLFMGIDFSGLWLTYVIFVDWDALGSRWTRIGPTAPPAPSAPLDDAPTMARVALALVVGAVLVAGAIEAGLRGATVGWPFACYPTFQDRAGTLMPALAIFVVRATGNEVAFDVDAGVPPADWPRERAFGLRLIASAGLPGAPARFAAYWQRLEARATAAHVRAVRFYAAQVSTLPEDRGKPPRALARLYELTLAPPATMMPRARSGATTSTSSDAAAKLK